MQTNEMYLSMKDCMERIHQAALEKVGKTKG